MGVRAGIVFRAQSGARLGKPHCPLEKAVNERCQSGTLGEDQQSAQQQQKNHDGRYPPLLALAQKIQELSNNRQSSVHGVKCLLSLSKRRSATILLPWALR